MAREELCTLTNLCMIYDKEKILVIDRKNPGWPGVTFPGGHVEPQESFVASVIREVKEETGLDIYDVELCGVQQWAREDGSRYIVFYFKTDKYSGELLPSKEGEVFWIDKKDLHNYKLADGFAKMFEIFDRDDLIENYNLETNGQWSVRNIGR